MRKLYVHAYQSYIWNCAATERIRRYGLDPVIGDLVIARNEQGELLSDTVDDRIRQVDTVTADNIARYRHEDIVLPLPGYDVKYPSNDIGKFIENIMKEDGLNPYDMKRKVE
jgi:tRNA pseudouridine13 synthase